ncbi:MAG: hypothetical protein Q9180_003631, partial [Flavoplaca navasiana]
FPPQPTDEHEQAHPHESPISDTITTVPLPQPYISAVQEPVYQPDRRSTTIEDDQNESHFWECSTNRSDCDHHTTVLTKCSESLKNSSDEEAESDDDESQYLHDRHADHYGGTRGWPFSYSLLPRTTIQDPPPYFLCPWPEPQELEAPQTPNLDTMSLPSLLFKLPPEIRFNVYDRLLPSKVSIIPFPPDERINRLPWALSSLSPELHQDVLPALYRSVTVVVWTKNEGTFRGTHRQAYRAWLAELNDGAASMIKHLIIDEIFSVRKLEGDIQPIPDGNCGVKLFDADEPTPCCNLGFNCSDVCSSPYCSKYDMDLTNVYTMGVSTRSGNWELKWIWEFDVDKMDRLVAMILVLGDIPANSKSGLGKKAIRGLVRAACCVEVESVRKEGSGEVFEKEIWPKKIYPHSWAWMTQRIRRQPYEE